MNYSSTNGDAQVGSLREALFQTFSSNGGLLMPETINPLPKEFLSNLHTFSFQEICLKVCTNLFGDEIPEQDLENESVISKVDSDYNSGIAIGINSTPTFIVNGRIIDNPQSVDAFKSLIDDELAKE